MRFTGTGSGLFSQNLLTYGSIFCDRWYESVRDQHRAFQPTSGLQWLFRGLSTMLATAGATKVLHVQHIAKEQT